MNPPVELLPDTVISGLLLRLLCAALAGGVIPSAAALWATAALVLAILEIAPRIERRFPARHADGASGPAR